MREVLIDQAVLATVGREAQASRFRHEVGGVLLGCYRADFLHVIGVTTPQRLDRSGAVRFWRASAGHQELALSQWRASRGTITYIGEWHSHPEDWPNPSSIDTADWRRKLAEQRRDLAFLIQGRCGVLLVRGSPRAGRPQLQRFARAADDGEGVLYRNEEQARVL